MKTSSSILEEAKKLYHSGRESYRDALLGVGRLFHEYILARLVEGEGHSNRQRRRSTAARRRLAVTDLLAGMNIRRGRYQILLGAAMVVDVLAEGDMRRLGNLGQVAISRFARFLHRGQEANNAAEDWTVKPGAEVKARELLARAAADTWSQYRCDAECKRLFGELFPDNPRVGNRFARKPESARSSRTTAKGYPRSKGASRKTADREAECRAEARREAQGMSPGDAAERCMEIIRSCIDPWLAAQRLKVSLEKVERPQRFSA